MEDKKDKPLKLVRHRTKEEIKRDHDKQDEYSRKHPEPLIWYLYNCERLPELTKKKKKKINQWVRKQLKEDPRAPYWEIDEKDEWEWESRFEPRN